MTCRRCFSSRIAEATCPCSNFCFSDRTRNNDNDHFFLRFALDHQKIPPPPHPAEGQTSPVRGPRGRASSMASSSGQRPLVSGSAFPASQIAKLGNPSAQWPPLSSSGSGSRSISNFNSRFPPNFFLLLSAETFSCIKDTAICP